MTHLSYNIQTIIPMRFQLVTYQVKTNAKSRIVSIQSGVESPQIVDSTQKMRIRLRQLEKSKDFQLRANIGVRSVANNSLIDMGIDKKRNVSKNIFSKNNLPIQMERNEVNDQLVAYSKANEILSHQLRELREYVCTIESSLPSKTAQNLSDISIVAKSMIDERDKKMGEKEIDRLILTETLVTILRHGFLVQKRLFLMVKIARRNKSWM